MWIKTSLLIFWCPRVIHTDKLWINAQVFMNLCTKFLLLYRTYLTKFLQQILPKCRPCYDIIWGDMSRKYEFVRVILLYKKQYHCLWAKCTFSFLFDGDNKWTVVDRYVKYFMEICHKHASKFCIKHFLFVNMYHHDNTVQRCGHIWQTKLKGSIC